LLGGCYITVHDQEEDGERLPGNGRGEREGPPKLDDRYQP
jgi:hypothetical protein